MGPDETEPLENSDKMRPKSPSCEQRTKTQRESLSPPTPCRGLQLPAPPASPPQGLVRRFKRRPRPRGRRRAQLIQPGKQRLQRDQQLCCRPSPGGERSTKKPARRDCASRRDCKLCADEFIYIANFFFFSVTIIMIRILPTRLLQLLVFTLD